MIEQSRPRENASRDEPTGRILKCPVCDRRLDAGDIDEVLLHAHDVTFDSTQDASRVKAAIEGRPLLQGHFYCRDTIPN